MPQKCLKEAGKKALSESKYPGENGLNINYSFDQTFIRPGRSDSLTLASHTSPVVKRIPLFITTI